MSQSISYDVVTIVNTIVHTAIDRSASDIHLEPQETGLRVRFRIDGLLYDQQMVDRAVASQIIARIKVLAHIDVAQTRIAQDGKISMQHKKVLIDLRVSTFPAVRGEKMVIRILPQSDALVALECLGMQEDMLHTFSALLTRSSGFLLVSGPTGAGKTTTLYAALSLLNTQEKNIITLEDPVEYCLSSITQGQIHPAIGFDFADGIRALLRQDPDVVFIGEIRDQSTAHAALQASLTGHMVLSTVHTTDAPSVVIRLIDMGIEPFLINAALSGVVAQRLTRTLCNECKQQREPDVQEQELLKKVHSDITVLYSAVGCQNCFGLGYKGRTGIFELLPMSEDLRQLITQRPSLSQLRSQALADGMMRMVVDGLHKVKSGTITLQELMRVAL